MPARVTRIALVAVDAFAAVAAIGGGLVLLGHVPRGEAGV
jgi:hypothetical protein